MKKIMFVMIMAMFISACAGVVGTPPNISRTPDFGPSFGIDYNGVH